jgi:DnaJ-class molecular chaperone
MVECPICKGKGYVLESKPPRRITCPKCRGRGFLREVFPSGDYEAIVRDEKRRLKGIF